MVSKLTVTADDFGLCPAVNEAVCRLHDAGVVGRAALLANTAYFEEAVAALRRRESLDVAIHLNLTDGAPVCIPSAVPSLVGRDGRFRGGRHYGVAARIAFGRVSPADVAREWRAQMEKVRAAGLDIRYLTSHGHVHLMPPLRRTVVALMREFAIPAMRVVLAGRSWRGFVLRVCSAGLVRELRRCGLSVAFPDRIVGLAHPGALTRSSLLDELAGAGDGFTEVIVHPAAGTNEHHRAWGYAGERELDALMSAEVGAQLREANR